MCTTGLFFFFCGTALESEKLLRCLENPGL